MYCLVLRDAVLRLRTLGRICGISIRHNGGLPFMFPPLVWKLIIGESVSVCNPTTPHPTQYPDEHHEERTRLADTDTHLSHMNSRLY